MFLEIQGILSENLDRETRPALQHLIKSNYDVLPMHESFHCYCCYDRYYKKQVQKRKTNNRMQITNWHD